MHLTQFELRLLFLLEVETSEFGLQFVQLLDLFVNYIGILENQPEPSNESFHRVFFEFEEVFLFIG